MNRERTMTAFYLETVLMVIIFVLVIMILSQVFGLSRKQSTEAELLTNAVCLAQNTAEAVAASGSEKALLELLDENGNAVLTKTDGAPSLTAYYDAGMHPVAEASAGEESLRVEVTLNPSPGETGDLVASDIAVYEGSGDKPVYTLQTGVYVKRQEGAK